MAVDSSTIICNMALSHLGVGKEIGSIDERTQEARACKLFYETARDAVLSDFPWTFAMAIAPLTVSATQPNSEWGYSYSLPPDCLSPRRLLSGTRTDSVSTRAAFRVAEGATGPLLLTDSPAAYLEYTARVDNPVAYPAGFALALSLRLAAYIGPRLMGGDPYKMTERAMTLYKLELDRAAVSSANEEQLDRSPEAEMIRARG